jgi:hypothetical protein
MSSSTFTHRFGRIAAMGRLPTRRRAYGRRPDSAPLVTDEHVIPYHAYWFSPCWTDPMPKGGVRYKTPCPRCGSMRRTLYGFRLSGDCACRACQGLRYPSQYQGRRPEAARDRLAALARSAVRSRSPEAAERRWARLEAADATYWRRERAYRRRMSAGIVAFAASFDRWLARQPTLDVVLTDYETE